MKTLFDDEWISIRNMRNKFAPGYRFPKQCEVCGRLSCDRVMNDFILLHETGAMDGVYHDERLAQRMLAYWRRQVPGKWALLGLAAGEVSIPDHLFAAQLFRDPEAS